jgi:hypothetical protein
MLAFSLKISNNATLAPTYYIKMCILANIEEKMVLATCLWAMILDLHFWEYNGL